MDSFNFFSPHLFSTLQSPVISSGDVDVTPRYRDIHFLIEEKSLDALDPSALSKFLEPLNSSSSSSDGLNFSDDELVSLCQSRYIQQPSDVQDFANYLLKTADDLKQKYNDISERKKSWDSFKATLQRGSSNIHKTDDNSTTTA